MVRIGIDLGGTNIVAGVVNEENVIIAKAECKTNQQSRDQYKCEQHLTDPHVTKQRASHRAEQKGRAWNVAKAEHVIELSRIHFAASVIGGGCSRPDGKAAEHTEKQRTACRLAHAEQAPKRTGDGPRHDASDAAVHDQLSNHHERKQRRDHRFYAQRKSFHHRRRCQL